MHKYLCRTLIFFICLLLSWFAQAESKFSVTFEPNGLITVSPRSSSSVTATIKNTSGREAPLTQACLKIPAGSSTYYTIDLATPFEQSFIPNGATKTVTLTITAKSIPSELTFTNSLLVNSSNASAAEGKGDFDVKIVDTDGNGTRILTTYNTDPIFTSLGQFTCKINADGTSLCTSNPMTGPIYPENITRTEGVQVTSIGNQQYGVYVNNVNGAGRLSMCLLNTDGSCNPQTAFELINALPSVSSLSVTGKTALLSDNVIGNRYFICELNGAATAICNARTAELANNATTLFRLKADPTDEEPNNVYVYTEGTNSYAIQKCNTDTNICQVYKGLAARSNSFDVKITGTKQLAVASRSGDSVTGPTNQLVECNMNANEAGTCRITSLADGNRQIQDLQYDGNANRLYVIFFNSTTDAKNGLAYFKLNANGRIKSTEPSYIQNSNFMKFVGLGLIP